MKRLQLHKFKVRKVVIQGKEESVVDAQCLKCGVYIYTHQDVIDNLFCKGKRKKK